MAASGQLRRGAIALAIAAAAVFARWHWDRLTAPQVPPALFDSQVYREIAARPLGVALLFYAKPPTVPLLYRVTGDDPAWIATVQAELAFAAWAVLAVALALALRRRVARGLAAGVAVAFLLAAPRIGWTGVLLSESVNDSLMALVAACAIGLAAVGPGRARHALTAGLAGLGVAWLFARDTNAIAALVALAVAAAVWPPRRWWTGQRPAVAVAGIAVAAALVALGSTRVAPDPLPFQRWWYPPLTARAGYPMLDNVLIRMMRGDRAWLAERGAPIAALAPFADPEPRTDKLVQGVPELTAAQDWLVAHGAASYLRWLVRHPVDRIAELIGARWVVLAGQAPATMPIGWIARDAAHPGVEALRRVTQSRWLLLALLAASPLLLRHPRRDPLTGVALCMIASGAVAAAASYYGDAVELARHCYGAGQQIVLGLFVALLAWGDRVPWRVPWRRPEPPPAPPAPDAPAAPAA